MENLGKKGFVALFFIALFLPLVYSVLPHVNRQNSGLVEMGGKVVWPMFTKADFLQGAWQEQVDAYVNRYLPFRRHLIRGFNTFDYYAFSHSYMCEGRLIPGQENWVYIQRCMEPYVRNRMTQEEMVRLAERIKGVETILTEKYQKKFIFVITPNKGYIYPEYLPHAYQPFIAAKGTSEYRMLRDACVRAGIRFVDGQALTEGVKARGIMPFAKTGLHWNDYTAGLALQELLGVWGLKKYDMPPPRLSEYQQTVADQDIFQLLNIYGQPEMYQYVSAKFHGIEDFVPIEGKLLVVAGSFGSRLVDNVTAWFPVFSCVEYEFYHHASHSRYQRKENYREIMSSLATEQYECRYYDMVGAEEKPLGTLADEEWKARVLSYDYILLEMNADLPIEEKENDLPTYHVKGFLDRAEKLL